MKTKIKKIAGWLQSATEKFSVRKKKTLLLLFCVGFTSLSVFAFLHRPKIFIAHGSVPVHIGKTYQPTAHSSISEAVFKRIELLKNNDSLLKANPNLLDTIGLIEKFYYSNSKK